MESNWEYKFSVVMPVYNTEEYLQEAVDSVLGQDIGFEENIQLILVNNATEDNSGQICETYKRKYPDNIEYVVLEQNIGPSGARNTGIPLIKGKYVNFLDSDDRWLPDAFRQVWDFFEAHHDEVDVVSCRMKYFEARHDYYAVLDAKFSSDRVCDLKD